MVLKREERRRPVTSSLHQSLETGLPMVTRAKTQSIQIVSTSFSRAISPSTGFKAEDEEPQECIVVNNYEVNVEIEETSVVVAKVEPQQGIFKSHVVPGK